MKLTIEIGIIRRKSDNKIWWAEAIKDLYANVQPTIQIESNDYLAEIDFNENYLGESEFKDLPYETEYFTKQTIEKEIEV